MRQYRVGNRFFFYTAGFACDCYNYVAILAEAFFAVSVLRASEFEMGLLGASSALGYALPCIATGLLSERAGRRTMLLIATAGQATVYLFTPHVSSIGALCLMSFLRSVATSFFWPPLMAWMSETSDTVSLSGVLGGYNVSWALGCVAGYAVTGVMFEYVSVQAPFALAAVLGAGTFLFFIFCTPSRAEITVHENRLDRAEVRSFVREGLVLNTLGYFTIGLVLYMFPKVVEGEMGEAGQGGLHVTRMLAQATTFFLLTHSRSWHFRRWPLWICAGAFTAGLFVIALSRAYVPSALGFGCLGVGSGFSYMLSVYYTLALIRRKGLGSGVQESLIGAGNLLGPLYGGTTATLSSPRGSLFAAVVPVLGAWIYLGRSRRRGPGRKQRLVRLGDGHSGTGREEREVGEPG